MVRPRRLLRALAAFLVALAALPASALGHAQLLETVPERGAVLDAAPHEVAFGFDEPLEAAFGAVRVYDAEGERVDDGQLRRPGGRDESIGVGLPAGLPDGTYTATYRVISADSHPVSGGFTFTVGEAPATAGATVSELLDEADAGPVTTVGFGVARGVGYAAIAVAVGGLAFLVLVWAPVLAGVAGAAASWLSAAEAFAARLRVLLLGATVAGALATLAGLAFQGAIAGGTSVWAALDPDVLGTVLETRYGEASAIRLGGWALFGTLVALALRGRSATVLRPAEVGATGVAPTAPLGPGVLAGLLLAAPALVVTPGLGGHAGAASPAGLVLGADAVHVVAMSAWVGGVVLLLAAVPAATRRLEGTDRSRLLAALVDRFTLLALTCVAALLATGILQSVVHLTALEELWETAFGRAIVIKSALLAGLIALGAVNRQRVRPRLRELARTGDVPGGAGRLLRTTLRAEVALFAVVLGVSAALVSYAPASAGDDVLSASATLGEARMELTVAPLTTGPQEIHLYLLDGATGAPWTRIRELDVSLEQRDKGVGPLDLDLERAGPGHFVADATTLAIPGTWTLRADLRSSRFDSASAEVEVRIR